jgi:hypothetical protein
MKCTLVVTWDGDLSKLIGRVSPVQSTGPLGKGGEEGANEANADDNSDDEDEDEDDDDDDDDDDDEAEPDPPAGNTDNLDFKYDPRDPAGLRLGQLSADDAARYHLIKSTCQKAGRLEEWKQALNSCAVELSSTISMQSLTNSRSKKAAKKIHEELQRYVCQHYFSIDLLTMRAAQAKQVYGLYGISVSGIILGSNLAAPSTAYQPRFFGPEPKFVDLLQNMLWRPQEVQQYLLSTAA